MSGKWLAGLALALTVGATHTPALAQSSGSSTLDAPTQALVAAGDVDGVASMLAAMAAGGADVTAKMEAIARLNPDIAGAVVNATLRTMAAAGLSAHALAPVVQRLTAGALSGIAATITPDQATVYSENMAANLRQAIGAIAGGNRNAENALLASARAGVARNAAFGAGGQVLRSNLSVRLQGSLDPNERQIAVNAAPIVVSRAGSPPPQQQQQQQQQQQNQQQVQQRPRPVIRYQDPILQENPQVDILTASPS